MWVILLCCTSLLLSSRRICSTLLIQHPTDVVVVRTMGGGSLSLMSVTASDSDKNNLGKNWKLYQVFPEDIYLEYYKSERSKLIFRKWEVGLRLVHLWNSMLHINFHTRTIPHLSAVHLILFLVVRSPHVSSPPAQDPETVKSGNVEILGNVPFIDSGLSLPGPL